MRKISFLLLTTAAFLTADIIPDRYIVELTTEPVAEHIAPSIAKATSSLRSAAAVSHRARIEGEQQTLREQMAARNVVVLDTVNTVANAIFVQTADPSQLASLPGVKRVIPVRRVHMLLDRVVSIHRVRGVWNQIGSERAGAGVKIAIIDSGIDSGHPGFQDSSMTAPASFPRVSSDADLAYTNGKVIVARSYVSLLPNRDADTSARDRVGHGTALAMAAAGVRNAGPLATITGIAPKAWLGNYKVFGSPGSNDASTDDAIIKAIDDAVVDGMDVINLSLGSDIASRLEFDPEVAAIERATRAGVIVVAAAGNNGPDLNTMSSPATAPSAIAVGATTNERTFAASVTAAGLAPSLAIPGDGPPVTNELTGQVADIAGIDGSGLACSPFPEGAAAGRIALILRGTCTFETKLLNAQRAGAIAAIVYAAEDSPSPIHMSVGTASLPAEMISWQDGVALRSAVAADSSRVVTARFTLAAVPITANLLTNFSASGPNVDLSIKPDLLAVGGDMYVATQRFDRDGDMYDPAGYRVVNGTSFSAPVVAGAAALLKAARPGLTGEQYRSLLVNSAATLLAADGQFVRTQRGGAGLLDVTAALVSNTAVVPSTLSFGAGGADATVSRTLQVSNVGTIADSFTITADSKGCSAAPLLPANTLQLQPGATTDLTVAWTPVGLAAGTCEGAITITSASTGSQSRVPWWYAVTSGQPAKITVLSRIESGRRGSLQSEAVLLRITDSAGVPVTSIQPEVRTLAGDASVAAIRSLDDEVPGLFAIDLRLGPATGENTLEITAADSSIRVSITAR